jgi:hypothetical protein
MLICRALFLWLEIAHRPCGLHLVPTGGIYGMLRGLRFGGVFICEWGIVFILRSAEKPDSSGRGAISGWKLEPGDLD